MIVITGPTGGGKSAAAMALAEASGGEIVSCDSLQVYRGLDIGSAKPTAEERRRVPHHLVDIVDPDEDFSAAEWARHAGAAVAQIEARGRLAIVVGGTGLYLKALLHGLFEGPSRNDELRGRLEAIALRKGDDHLHAVLRRIDAVAAGRIAPTDRLRVVRALEVALLSGRRISDQQTQGERGERLRAAPVLGLDPGRDRLRELIERRCDAMLGAGLVGEVEALVRRYAAGIRPLKAIGYRQMIRYMAGELTSGQAREEMIHETRRFAKRQRTWFRRQTPPDRWFEDGGALVEAALALVRPEGPGLSTACRLNP